MTLYKKLLTLLKTWFAPHNSKPPEVQRAIDLIAAIDAGGVPLFPGRVNEIARSLGLEVALTAPIEETIERIRVALAYSRGS
ncbi:MAG: hypothetical protein ACI90C_000123 [Rhodoferax sp.]|jgi:hypothetical protein